MCLRAAETLTPTPAKPETALLAWTENHRRRLRPGVAFDLHAHPYLTDLYASTAQRIVVRKAGQVGASEWLVSYALHAADARHLDVLYVMPTEDDISDFSTTRFGMAMEASPYLQSIVVDSRKGDAAGRRGVDKMTLKRIRDNWLYFRGGRVRADGNAPQLKSLPAGCVVFDEFDEIDPRAPALARKRLGHSDVAEERMVSTPTYVGIGIDAEWAGTTQQFWHLQCQGCRHRQPVTIDDLVIEWDDLQRPIAWRGMADKTAWLACRHCGKPLDRMAPGLWVPAYPDRDIVGFQLSKLIAPWVDLAQIVANLQTTNESKRKEAYNQDLGLPYAPRGAGITAQILDAATRDYGLATVPPADVAGAVMGVDVGLLLHVVIRAGRDPQTGERRLLHAGAVATFEEVDHLIRRYRVRACVVDALPETRKARELQSRVRPGVVWLCYYAGGDGPKSEDLANWNQDQGTVTTDRTRSLDETVTRFAEAINTLPAGARQIPDYYPHLTSLVRVIEKRRDGNQAARWVETGPDHFAHAENYCTIAGLRTPTLGVMAQGVARRKLPS